MLLRFQETEFDQNDTDTDEENTGLLGAWDEAASDPLEVTVPRPDWVTGLSARYRACGTTASLHDNTSSNTGGEEGGAVVVEWRGNRPRKYVTGYKLVWWSVDGAVNDAVALPCAARSYHVSPVSPRSDRKCASVSFL